MILKLLGAGCILLSCTGFVLSKEREFAEHKRQLDELAFFLTLLQNEICRLRFPLSVVLEHCAAAIAKHGSTPLHCRESDIIGRGVVSQL